MNRVCSRNRECSLFCAWALHGHKMTLRTVKHESVCVSMYVSVGGGGVRGKWVQMVVVGLERPKLQLVASQSPSAHSHAQCALASQDSP